MHSARQDTPNNRAPPVADIVIVSDCAATRARLAAAVATSPLRIRLDDLSGLAAAMSARGVLIHLSAAPDRCDEMLTFAAEMTKRRAALALLRDDNSDDGALDRISNLPPSTLRRLRALLASDSPTAASALIDQFALAAGLSTEPAE